MEIPASRAIGGALALAVGVLVLVLWPRTPVRPEELIRHQVISLVASAEHKELSGVMDNVSERFTTPDGWSKQDLKGFLAAQLLGGTWVRIFTVNLEVAITGGSAAEVSGKFIFGRSEAKQLEQLAKASVMSAYAIDARLEREADGQWRVVWARYQPVEGRNLY